MTTSFTEMFPELITEGRRLYDTFAIISSVIMFGGLCVAASQGAYGDLGRAVRGLLTAGLVVVMIGIFPRLTDLLQEIGHTVVVSLNADPSESHQQFANFIVGSETDGKAKAGMWDVLLSDDGGFGSAILYAIVLMLGKVAFAIMWIATLMQNLILLFGVAVAPPFLAMAGVESLRGIANRYFLSLTSVICWPLGWAIADLVTRGLLKIAAGDTGVEIVFLVLFLSLWMLISTIAAPFAVTKLLLSGSQIGGSLLKSIGMAASQGVSHAVGAGVSTSLAGGGTAATAAATVTGGAAGLVSGATETPGFLIPGLIATATVMASSRHSEKEAAEMADKLKSKKSS